MEKDAHLWALGYDDPSRAAEVRDELARLAERHCLTLLDTAVAVRWPDGILTVDEEPFVVPRWQPMGILG